MLALLRRRDFGLLWLSGLISVAGDWALITALPFYVYSTTGSTVATAAMIAAELLPGVLLGTVAGVFVDRWDRRSVLVAANVAQAVVVALLLLVPLDGFLWVVYVVAAAQSALAAFAAPAESALIPALVADEELVPANALNSLNNRLGRLLGVPAGGLLLELVGLRSVVLVDCVSFLVAAALVAAMTRRPAPPVAEDAADAATDAARSAFASFWEDWRGGLRLIGRDRTIALIFLVLGLMTFGGTMLDPLYPAWVHDVLGRGPDVYALLTTVHAASGIAATLVVGRVAAGWAPRHLIGWASLVAGAANLVKFNVPSLGLAIGLSVLVGVTSVTSNIGVETLVQRGVPDSHRGRVFGALGASGAALSLLGAAVGGVGAELVGTVTVLSVASGLIVLAGLVVLWAFAVPADAGRSGPTAAVDSGAAR